MCLWARPPSTSRVIKPASATGPGRPLRLALVSARLDSASLVHKASRALLVSRRGKYKSAFEAPSKHRGTTGRGKQGHFHLLDRYIRRIDALLPEDMEDLVRPLSYKPNLEQTSRTIKITFPDELVLPGAITEDQVRAFLPVEPEFVALGWNGTAGDAEVYVRFPSNEECQIARKTTTELLGPHVAQVRYGEDKKFRWVMEHLGLWEPGLEASAVATEAFRQEEVAREESDGQDRDDPESLDEGVLTPPAAPAPASSEPKG